MARDLTPAPLQGVHNNASQRDVSIFDQSAAAPVSGMPSFLWGGATGRSAEEASGAGSVLLAQVQQLMMRKPLHAWWAADKEGSGEVQ